jgi:peptidoglycan/xylan/chitin deacetylase (PgdA/CDA1 family)
MYHRVGGRRRRVQLVSDIDRRLFAAQLRWVRSRYRVVGLGELSTAVAQRRAGEPFPVAVTFDDDNRSHVAVAAPMLREFGIPATFFVGGVSLDGPRRPWWERLEDAVEQGRWRPPRGVALLEFVEQVKRLPHDDEQSLSETLRRAIGPDPDDSGLRADDIGRLSELGFELGFHTLRHESLPLLDDDALTRALTEGRSILEELGDRRLTAIAYPYCHADERVARAARAAGFATGFTCEQAAVTPDSDPMLLGRLDPRPRSLGDFALQLARAVSRVREHR